MPNSADVEKRINAIRCLSIDAVQKANSGHPGLPLGAAAMAYALWTRHLRYDPSDPHWFNRDRFILSAGHGSMLLYSLLYLTGFGLTLDDLKSFRQLGSKTPGHPEYPHTPGVEATTGPLGQGIANAVGFAIAEAHLAAVYNRQERIVDHYTYVIAGDGDLMEGISGEAASLAGHLGLGKLIVLYDDNDVTLAGPTAVTFTEDQAKRYEAYGWHTQFIDVEHGNDVGVIDRAITAAKAETSRPSIILIRTHIGYGSPRQDTYLAHGEPLGAENVAKTKEFLGWPLEPPFFVPDDVLAWWRAEGARGRDVHAEWDKAYAAWSASNPELAAQLDRMRSGRLPENLPWPTFTAENGSVATRDAGGTVMNAIAAELPELMGGSADLDPSTKTYLKGFGDFEPGNYAGRNVHFGVREHAMGCRGQRHRLARRATSIHGDLLQLRRLHEARGALGRAQPPARRVRLHARFDLPGRRRADASAGGATRDVAGAAEHGGDSPRRFGRGRRSMEVRGGFRRPAGGARAQPAEASVPRRARRGGIAWGVRSRKMPATETRISS